MPPQDVGYHGISKEDIQNQQKKQEDAQSVQKEEPSQKQSVQQQEEEGGNQVRSSTQQQSSSEKSETDEQRTIDEKDLKILQNTFGVDFDSDLDSQREKIANIAKSYREAQSKFTKEQEQRQLHESTLNNFEQQLQQYPEVWDTVQKVAKGEYDGNSKQEPKGKPKKKSQPAVAADEQTLIDEGYLDQSELDGLDEIARNRVVAEAKADYHIDKRLSEFEQQTRETIEKVRKDESEKERKERIQRTNKERLDDAFDRFVADYGVNFTELDDNTIDAIRKRANVIRDPSDPSLLDVDAFYDAAQKELAIRDKLPKGSPKPNATNGVNQILDTGHNVNRKSNKAKPKTAQEIMDEDARQRWERVMQNTDKLKQRNKPN